MAQAPLQDSHDTGLRPSDVEPERPQPIDTPWGSFAIYVVGGELRALQSFCPHLAGPLFQGTRSADEITCPWHGWRYSLVDGQRTDRVDPDTERRREHALVTSPIRIGPEGTIVLGRPVRDMGLGDRIEDDLPEA